jgi:molybdopterin converting factor small subunit
MATVWIPSLLRPLTGGQREVTADGATVGALIDALDAAYPGLRARLRDGDRLQPGIAIVVDGETGARGLLDTVKPDSEVHIVPAIGGGEAGSITRR